jgi:hypothetical protein
MVADPPWDVKFGEDTRRAERASTGSPKGTWTPAAMNYNTMTLDEIKAPPVANVAADNAHLYIWTINAYIEQTYAVARAWSFRPVALLTWAKTPRGLGFGGAFVQTTEHILFRRRGLDVVELDATRKGHRPETLPQAGSLPKTRGECIPPARISKCSPVGNATDGTYGVTRSNVQGEARLRAGATHAGSEATKHAA